MADPIPAPKDDRDYRITMFTAYLEDLGRIGTRHENTRTFYLSVISALFVFLSLAGSTGIFAGAQRPVQMIVGGVGVSICIGWFRHMSSFADIYAAKGDALRAVEKALPVHPFELESAALSKNHTRLTAVDKFTAGVCVILFLILILVKFNAPPTVV